MTLSDVMDKVYSKTTYIDESCNERHIATHFMFGFGEKAENNDCNDDCNDDELYFFLYWDASMESIATKLKLDQEISIEGNRMKVIDSEGNRLTLMFFNSNVLPLEQL